MYFAKCITKADIFVYFMKALYKLVLPPSDQVVVEADLYTSRSIRSCQYNQDISRQQESLTDKSYPRTQFDNQWNVTCFTCCKVGHKSVDCFMNTRLTNNQRSTSSVAQKPFSCFSCGEQVHSVLRTVDRRWKSRNKPRRNPRDSI